MPHTLVWLTDECMQKDCVHHCSCAFANGVRPEFEHSLFQPTFRFEKDATGAGIVCESYKES